MTKQELASYMCNLVTIMESKEDAGIGRGQTLGREYNRCYDQLIDIIRKDEQDDKARKSRPLERSVNEAGADSPRR